VTDRTKERITRAAKTTLAAAASRVVIVLTSFITIPLVQGYVGPELFGIWMTLVSLYAFVAFSDLGIGNGLINLVAQASAQDDADKIREYFTSSLFALTAAAIFIATTALSVISTTDLQSLFGIQERHVDEVRRSVCIFIVCAVLSVPAGLVQKLRVGLQQGYANGMWNLAASALTLGALVLLIGEGASFSALVLTLTGVPLLTSVLHTTFYFGSTEGKQHCPSIRSASIGSFRSAFNLGAMYFALQVASALSTSADNSIIASNLGARVVADYAIAAKLFALIGIAIGMVLQPLWPMYAEANARGEEVWIVQVFNRMQVVVLLSALLSAVVLVAFHQQVTTLWIGRELELSFTVVLGFATAAVVDALAMNIATYLNGRTVLKPQVIAAVAAALISVSLKVWLVRSIGVEALPWVAAGSAGIVFLLPMTLLVFRQSRSRNSP